MKLDQDTLEVIMSMVIGADEIEEIFAFLDAEEKFRAKLFEMSEARMRMAYRLSADTELTPDTRRGLERLLRQQEPKLAELLKRCVHWTRQPDGRCNVCGEPL